jgi:thiol-disulfide isomerase/thioredoxin
MTFGSPEKELSAPAPVRNRARILFALMGIAVLTAALAMAYRESTRTTASAPDAASASSNKTGFAFDIYPQPHTLPNVRFADGNGRAMTLQDFRGKFVLLNVWATWCVPCRKEMPTLDRLQAKLGGPDFEVVALSIDRGGPLIVSTFYSEIGIRALRIYVDKTSDAATALGVVGIPVTLLIDREGREIGRKIGPAEWDSPEIINLIRGYVAPPASKRPVKRDA